jgi:N-acetylglucosamine kinase-like BadF-type ATPase
MTDWIFGIDGGGTSTRLRVESIRGELLFYGEGGSTNLESNSHEAVAWVLHELFERVRESGLRMDKCRAGFAGSAGIDRSADRKPFADLLRQASGTVCPLGVGNDSEPALAGALSDTEGIILIAGTGSISFGRAKDGSAFRAGGYGHLLGDEGSAWGIAFDALRRGLRSGEGRDLPTDLLDAALEHFGLDVPEDLIHFVHGGIDKTRIAHFARVVGAWRDRGDALAIDLFSRAAAELCALVISVYDRVSPKLIRKRAAYRGGLIESDAWLRNETTSRIGRALPGLDIIPAAEDAARGACILAKDLID